MRHGKKALSLTLALSLALSLLPAAALAAAEQPERGVVAYSEVVAPQYEDAQPFSEGLAAVKKDGKWGYIDTAGKVVIPFLYDQAYPFREGKAVVGTLSEQNSLGKYYFRAGFLDRSGKYTAFQTIAGQAAGVYYMTDTQDVTNQTEYMFHNGYVALLVSMYSYDLFDASGNKVYLTYEVEGGKSIAIPMDHPVNEGFASTYDGYYDLASQTIVPIQQLNEETYPNWRVTNYYPFNQGLAGVWIAQGPLGEEKDYELGFVNTSGEWVIQPFPASLVWINGPTSIFCLFGETGLAMIENTEGKYGAIDKTGKTVIPFRYEDLQPVSEGLIAFRENGKYGYLDAGDLSVVIPAQYEMATGFDNGVAVAYDGTKAFLIDREGGPVPGADKLRPSTYFWEEDGIPYYRKPVEYVIIEASGKYGYGHIEYLPPLPEKDEMDGWAYDEVVAAIEEDLVPVYLQNLYRSSIKRGEFCDLTMQAVTQILNVSAEELVQQRTGRALTDWIGEYPFTDTADSNVIAAYALDIVSGRGDGTFDPYATITRQEAATLLTNGAKVLDMDTTVINQAGYADGGAVAGWARDSVNYVAQINVMNGTGGNNFSPNGTYSREQSFMTVYRLCRALLETQK